MIKDKETVIGLFVTTMYCTERECEENSTDAAAGRTYDDQA